MFYDSLGIAVVKPSFWGVSAHTRAHTPKMRTIPREILENLNHSTGYDLFTEIKIKLSAWILLSTPNNSA